MKVISLLVVLSTLPGNIPICHCLFLCKHVFTLCVSSDTDFKGLMVGLWFLLCVVGGCFGAELWDRAVQRAGEQQLSTTGGSPLGRAADSAEELFLLLFHRLP